MPAPPLSLSLHRRGWLTRLGLLRTACWEIANKKWSHGQISFILACNHNPRACMLLSSQCTCLLHWGSQKGPQNPVKMGTQGSLKYYENRDPGPHFSMNMGTQGSRFGGSLFSCDTGYRASAKTTPTNLLRDAQLPSQSMGMT